MGKVTINQAVINKLGSWGPVDRDMEKRAHRVSATARGRGRIDTGEYVSSIEVRALPRRGYRIIATAPHSVFLEFGTRPHEIRPRTAAALWWPGAPHPMARVWHPGTRPTNNMAEALELGARGDSHV